MYELLLVLTIGINIAADFLDRYASNKSDPYVLTLWTSIVQFLLIFPTIGLVSRLSLYQLILIALVSGFAAYGRIRWFRALSERGEQLSRLAPLARVSSVIVLILAVTILGESMTLKQAIGAGMIILGAFLISFERWSSSLRKFIGDNRALGLVLIFAASMACISVLYKYLLTPEQGVTIWTMYFYMRLFQVLPLFLYGMHRNVITTSYSKIANLKLFVFGRVLQTIAAFLFLIVIRQLPLTTVEPIAALTPLIFLLVEWVNEKYRLLYVKRGAIDETPKGPEKRALKTTLLRFAAVTVTILGILFLRRV